MTGKGMQDCYYHEAVEAYPENPYVAQVGSPLAAIGQRHKQLIKRVNIGRDYEIEIEFKISVTQFFDFLQPEGDRALRLHAA